MNVEEKVDITYFLFYFKEWKDLSAFICQDEVEDERTEDAY